MDVMNYVKPELIVVAIALYFIGVWMKNSEVLKDKYIPLLHRHCAVCHLGVGQFAYHDLAGGGHGGIYRDCAGHPGGRIKHLCESGHQAE